MKLTSIITTALILTFSLKSNAQTESLKNYSGPYEISLINGQTGNAVYTYKEDKETEERTKHGNFKYTFVGNGRFEGLNITIIGAFINGKKNGLWTYTIVSNNFTNGEGGYSKGTMSLKANFKNGIPNGLWEFSNSGVITRPTRNQQTRKIEYKPISKPNSEKLTATFKNGFYSGAFLYNSVDQETNENINITATFIDSGYFDGKFIHKVNSEENIRNYYKGYLLKHYIKNTQTGSIQTITDNTNDKYVFDQYLNKQPLKDSTFESICYKFVSEYYKNSNDSYNSPDRIDLKKFVYGKFANEMFFSEIGGEDYVYDKSTNSNMPSFLGLNYWKLKRCN